MRLNERVILNLLLLIISISFISENSGTEINQIPMELTSQQLYTVVTGSDVDGVNEIRVLKPFGYDSDLVIKVFGNNDVPDGYSNEAYFELFSPSFESLGRVITRSFNVYQEFLIPKSDPIGVYFIKISLPSTPTELQCCFSLNYQFSFPDDIPIPISTASGMFNFKVDQGYLSLRNIGSTTLQFGAFLIEGTEYTLEHDPWGPMNLIENVTLIGPTGLSEELSGSSAYGFTPAQTGYFGLELQMDQTSPNTMHRMWALRLMEGSIATKDSIIPMYPVFITEELNGDVDGDFIYDQNEPTNYLNPDQDGDGLSDGMELLIDTNSLDGSDFPIDVDASVIRDGGDFVFHFWINPTRADLIDLIEYNLLLEGDYELATISADLTGFIDSAQSVDIYFKTSTNILLSRAPLGFSFHLRSNAITSLAVAGEYYYTVSAADNIPAEVSFSDNVETTSEMFSDLSSAPSSAPAIAGGDILSLPTPLIFISIILIVFIRRHRR